MHEHVSGVMSSTHVFNFLIVPVNTKCDLEHDRF